MTTRINMRRQRQRIMETAVIKLDIKKMLKTIQLAELNFKAYCSFFPF